MIDGLLIGRMMQKSGEDLSPEMWIMKLLLGPIDTSYDSKGGSRLRDAEGIRSWQTSREREGNAAPFCSLPFAPDGRKLDT